MTNLNVFASGHLFKVLLLLQGLVHFIICHAKASQIGFHSIVHFGKYYKLGHVGHTDEFPVELSGQSYCFWNLMAVCKPEPVKREGQKIRNKVNIVDIWVRGWNSVCKIFSKA